MSLKKNGTFGWTPMTYVFEVAAKKDVAVGFGLWAAGHFWIDDVSLVRVGEDATATATPEFGKEEKAIAPPGRSGWRRFDVPIAAIRTWLNGGPATHAAPSFMGSTWPRGRRRSSLRRLKTTIHSVEQRSSRNMRTDGTKAVRLDKNYASWGGAQDWSGFDYLKADLYTDSEKPLPLTIEIRDQSSNGYWTRVNYETLVAPGKSTLVLPLAQLYVGEKARPGRNLILNAINYWAIGIGPKPGDALYRQHPPRTRHRNAEDVFRRPACHSILVPAAGPLMPGFTRIDPSIVYSKGRGHGLKDAQIWRAFDALHPIRSTRISSASPKADWPSMFPTASITSSSTSTIPPASGANTKPTGIGKFSPRARPSWMSR